jgi:hypothetical protein
LSGRFAKEPHRSARFDSYVQSGETMDKTTTFAFAKRIREISYSCFDLGAAERLRLLADEIQGYEESREPKRQDPFQGRFADLAKRSI